MKRAVLYARYSTDLQSPRSIDDQFNLCRAFAEREDLVVTRTYEDRGMSGGTLAGRKGILELLAAADRKEFDVLIVEALDRLARNNEDLNHIHNKLNFLGIPMIAVNDGGQAATTITVGLQGLMGQVFREEGRKKIRRGMEPRARQGQNMGGKAYGYVAKVKLTHDERDRGKLEIIPEQAEVVQRIFTEYSQGKSPRQIACALNNDKIPSPSGGKWNASTINGSKQRANGILGNEKYAGRLVWNRIGMVQNPNTGKRISRPNKPDDYVRGGRVVPAIIDDTLWNCVQAIRQTKTHQYNSTGNANKPKRLLSQKLKCGCCGAGMSSIGRDRNGRIRIQCSAHRESGTCKESSTYYLDKIEKLVLGRLPDSLEDQEVVKAFVRAYEEERRRLASDKINERSKIERRIGELERALKRLGHMLIDEIGDEEENSRNHKAAATEKRELEVKLAALDEEIPSRKIEPHPALIDRYIESIRNLQPTLERGLEMGDPDLLAVRDLIDKVIIHPDGTVEIKGRLEALSGGLHFPLERTRNSVWGATVSDLRYHITSWFH